MSVVILCPHCQRQLRLPPELIGQQCRCPECRQILIANPPPTAIPVVQAQESIQPKPTVPAPAPPRQEPRVSEEPGWEEFAPPGQTPPNRPNSVPPQAGTPWSLYVPAALMVVVFCWLVWGKFWGKDSLPTFIWGAIGVSCVGLAWAIAKKGNWSIAVRAVLTGLMVSGSYAVLLVLFVIALFRTAPSLDSAIWRSFTIPDGSLTIQMPGSSKHDRTPIDNSVDGLYLYISEHAKGQIAYVVGQAVLTEREARQRKSAHRRLRDFQQGMAMGIPDSELVSSKEIDFEGNPGIEVVFEHNKSNLVIVARNYVVGRRIYTVSAVGPYYTPDTPDVKKFFDSLHIDESRPIRGSAKAVPKEDPLQAGTLVATASAGCKMLRANPTTATVAALCGDGLVRVWDTTTGTELWNAPAKTSTTIQFSPDGTQLLIAGHDNATLCNAKTGEFGLRKALPAYPSKKSSSFAFGYRGSSVLVALAPKLPITTDKRFSSIVVDRSYLEDRPGNTILLPTSPLPPQGTTHYSFSRGGHFLVVHSPAGYVLYRLPTITQGQPEATIERILPTRFCREHLFVSSVDAHIFAYVERDSLHLLRHPNNVAKIDLGRRTFHSMTLSPKGRWLAMASHFKIHLWTGDGDLHGTIRLKTGLAPNGLTLSADGKYVLAVNTRGEIRRWNVVEVER